MKFYCVRHGQTIFNVKGMIQGWCDSPLTEKGISDAQAVGKGLSNIPFVHAYSSTSERAIDTLNYILEDRNINKSYLKGLKETNFGMLEGEPVEKAKDWQKLKDEDYQKVGGEKLEESALRFLKTLEDIAGKNEEGNILIVSHGTVLTYASKIVDFKKTASILQSGSIMDNCYLMILEYSNNEFQLLEFADGTYLEKGREILK